MREPLFILSPPRSFSSLISSMIGQHPEMHAFPELQIFGKGSLLDMMIQNQEKGSRLASPGCIRSIAEVHEHKQTNESCTRAWLWMQKHGQMTAAEFFNYLREQVAPQIAVEKSPPNTQKLSHLQDIMTEYPNAKFLHLTRSVVGNQSSLKEYLAMADQLMPRDNTEGLNAKIISKKYPAIRWYLSHRNILTVKPIIKPGNYLRVKGEDVLSDPPRFLQQFCRWMQIDSSPSSINAMMRPHESPYACIGPRIADGGNDPKFMQEPVLRLKPPTTQAIHSFRQSTNANQLQFDNFDLFRQQGQLSKDDLAGVEKWLSHVYHEVQSMQIRLGY